MVHAIYPLSDPRWDAFVREHPRASVFHTSGWLRALQRTYRYDPVAFTTAPPGAELRNVLVFCAIRSWLTGRRLVSLPFADHCDPLVENAEAGESLWADVCRLAAREGRGFVEVRPALQPLASRPGFEPSETYYWHRLDLRQGPEALWRGFHADCIRRKIRRAEREALRYREGRSADLVEALYTLVRETRQRHGLPPAPWKWFRNLVAALGEDVSILTAWKDDRLAAGILTLRSGRSVMYKYGGSDPALNHLGGMVSLLWRAISAARAAGAEAFDLGRSDCDQEGLVTFKDRWGAERRLLAYYRYPVRRNATRRRLGVARTLFARMPPGVLALAGRLLYRHVG